MKAGRTVSSRQPRGSDQSHRGLLRPRSASVAAAPNAIRGRVGCSLAWGTKWLFILLESWAPWASAGLPRALALGPGGLRMPGWLWARVHGPSAGERSFPLPAGFRSPFLEPTANSRDIGNLQTGERPHPPLPGPAHFSSWNDLCAMSANYSSQPPGNSFKDFFFFFWIGNKRLFIFN